MADTISVEVPAVLAEALGNRRRATVPAGTDMTVAAVLDVLAADHPRFNRRVRDETGAVRRYVNVYVDGEHIKYLAGTATPVAPGQEVLIIQSVAGG